MDINSVNCIQRIYSDEYGDFIIEYYGERERLEEYFKDECLQIIDDEFAIAYTKRVDVREMSVTKYGYQTIPKLFGLMDESSMQESGVLKARNQPSLDLRGKGVIIGFIDTGIDYNNSLFKNADGTTRILSIWDQTIMNESGNNPYAYGSIYTSEMINEALRSENPLEIVPSTDNIGHGTFLAGIASGNEDTQNNFTGAAPDSMIAVVKLKEAKPYLKEFFAVGMDKLAYQENDIMMGVKYLSDLAREYDKPLVICIGLGSNSGTHSDTGPLITYVSDIANKPNSAIVVAVGNEGSAKHHYEGYVGSEGETIEVNLAPGEFGFTLEVWGEFATTFSITFESPLGSRLGPYQPKLLGGDVAILVLENTRIYIDYRIVEVESGIPLILIRFFNPSEGIWKIILSTKEDIQYQFNMWLPITNFLSDQTFFLKSSPDTTITSPSTARNCISVGGYNHINSSLYYNSGRGYTLNNRVVPDIVAPAVDIIGPGLNNRFVTMTGTSIAAAHTAGG